MFVNVPWGSFSSGNGCPTERVRQRQTEKSDPILSEAQGKTERAEMNLVSGTDGYGVWPCV